MSYSLNAYSYRFGYKLTERDIKNAFVELDRLPKPNTKT